MLKGQVLGVERLSDNYCSYDPIDAIGSQNPQWDRVSNWTGKWRDTAKYCDVYENPCENGGKCFFGGDVFRCECQPGWEGEKCETGRYR